MSALPKKVQQKIDAANKLHQDTYGQLDGPELTGVVAEPKIEDASGAPQAAEETLQAVDTADKSVVQNESEEPSASVAQPPEDSTNAEKWEHKYKVLNGKYKAEVPRLQGQVRELSGQISQLQATLSSLEVAKSAEQADAEPAAALLKDDEITEYGAELIDVVKRAAREELAPEVTRLSSENAELKRQLSTFNEGNAKSARQTVYDALNDKVPTWEALNLDTGFLQWLGTLDAYTNRLRSDLLKEAFEANDAARVVVFFEGYLNENAAVSQQQGQTPAKRTAQVDMSTLAAPGKPRGGAAPGTQEGQQTWRQAEISAFYADVRRGKFKNDPKQKLKIEQSINAAVNSNRIVA